MEAEDPLSQLRDIHLPDPVSFWPPAPGWWFLLFLVLAGLVFLCRHAIAAMIRRRKLAFVLRELDAAYATFNAQAAVEGRRNQAGLEFLATVNILLKRVCQVMFPDGAGLRLTGRDWLGFLDACDAGDTFRQGAGAVLADGAYRPRFDADASALYDAARQWIENRYKTAHMPERAQGVAA